MDELSRTMKLLTTEVAALRQTQESNQDALAASQLSLHAKVQGIAEVVQTSAVTASPEDSKSSSNLALLIDADNTSWKALDVIMAEVSRHGNAIARRGYGDFTTPTLAPWKEPMAKHAIMPSQTYQNTVGKNSSDSAMIIDAVELLYLDRFDVFCLVSSDADFTSLAMRIREQGKTVVGIGKQQTARSFVAACNTFVETETLMKTTSRPIAANAMTSSEPAMPTPLDGVAWSNEQKQQLMLLREIVEEIVEDNGWGTLDKVGSLLKQRDPAFDPRKLGSSSAKLSSLLSALDSYEVSQGNPKKVRLVKK